MQRLLAAGLCIAAIGCGTLKGAPPISEVAVVDFRALTADGFLLSPDPFIGPHDPLGQIFVTLQGGTRVAEGDEHVSYKHLDYIHVTIDSAVAIAKERAKALGADGITNLRITTEPRVFNSYTAVGGWLVTGLAIRRTSR